MLSSSAGTVVSSAFLRAHPAMKSAHIGVAMRIQLTTSSSHSLDPSVAHANMMIFAVFPQLRKGTDLTAAELDSESCVGGTHVLLHVLLFRSREKRVVKMRAGKRMAD